MSNEIERRKHRRLPASIPVRTTNPALGNVTGVTRDVSVSGAFFYMESDLWKQGASIEYVVQLPAELGLGADVSVLCNGTIVRVERLNGRVGLAVRVETFSVLRKQ